MKSSTHIGEETLDSESWVIISIVDSGSGIPENLQDKLFTPFFTTKALGEGIGLGLYVSRKIVHEHRGRIYFESREGRTEFVIVLPFSSDIYLNKS
jgi:signal transduction histidine kinase